MEKISGIYFIKNVINNKLYVGQAQDIYYRWKKHRETLRVGKDNCVALQNAWNLYGEENFNFEIIKLCKVDELDKFEIFYINKFKSHVSKNGYNISFGGNSVWRGQTHSEKTKMKISNSGIGKHHTEEARNKISNSRKGIIFSNETKRKMSESKKGKNSSWYGKHHSDETKRKMSESAKGHKRNLGRKTTEEARKKQSEARKSYWRKKNND